MINAFIRNRHFAVHINESISNKISIPAGLAQGTSLSPILYSLYVADLPIISDTNAALYADDTAIYTSFKQSNSIINKLNVSLSTLQQYFHKWKIKVNATKTQAIIFPFDNKRIRTPTTLLKNGNEIIKLDKSVNYLGVTLDSKLIFQDHINKAIDKANKCYRALYPIISHRSKLSTTNKSLIYTVIIRPILSYASPIWFSAADSHLIKFKRLQNKILKTIFNLHKRTPTAFLEHITGIKHFSEFIENQNINFSNNCEMSDYNLIREIDLL